MKKLSLLMLAGAMFFAVSTAQAQSDNSGYVYLDLIGKGKMMSSKINVVVDVGEQLKAFASNKLKDPSTGKPIVFNSMVDALNYMGARGWDFEQAYAVVDGSTTIYHYLMKKPREQVEGLPAADE